MWSPEAEIRDEVKKNGDPWKQAYIAKAAVACVKRYLEANDPDKAEDIIAAAMDIAVEKL